MMRPIPVLMGHNPPGFSVLPSRKCQGESFPDLVGWKTWLAGSPGGLGLDTSVKIFTFIVEFY